MHHNCHSKDTCFYIMYRMLHIEPIKGRAAPENAQQGDRNDEF
jgi:hypothetical protein